MQRVLMGLSLAALLGAPGCAKPESGAQAESAEISEGEVDAVLEEVYVPTEEEAAAEAAAEINESNADEEFARLKAEIEGDSDG